MVHFPHEGSSCSSGRCRLVAAAMQAACAVAPLAECGDVSCSGFVPAAKALGVEA